MVHIGVLISPPIQLLDIGPIDLFAMMTQEYFQACNLPQPMIDLAIATRDMNISYIAPAGSGSTCDTTAHVGLTITTSLDDPRVAPGKLDIIMIPGPPPDAQPPEKLLQFLRGHVDHGVDLLTVCTGIFVAGYAGILDGKNATGPRALLDTLGKKFPKVHWVDQRYIQDKRTWTSGGITNGMDMVAMYLKQRWPGTLSDTVLALADVEPRPAKYGQSKAALNMWFVWKIAGAWFKRWTGGRKNE